MKNKKQEEIILDDSIFDEYIDDEEVENQEWIRNNMHECFKQKQYDTGEW